jgi:hypothetical protein
LQTQLKEKVDLVAELPEIDFSSISPQTRAHYSVLYQQLLTRLRSDYHHLASVCPELKKKIKACIADLDTSLESQLTLVGHPFVLCKNHLTTKFYFDLENRDFEDIIDELNSISRTVSNSRELVPKGSTRKSIRNRQL